MVETRSPQEESPFRYRESCGKDNRNERKDSAPLIPYRCVVVCVVAIAIIVLIFKGANLRKYYWGDFQRSRYCHSYATRVYSANLWNVAPGENAIAACYRSPTVINGKAVRPTMCEDRGAANGVRGQWYIDFHEEDCMPSWGKLHDKGCVAGRFGVRRVEARLMNLQRGDNWQAMCVTTPKSVNGIWFDHPTKCEDRGFLFGMVGIWEYPDRDCA